ncbi:MAG TPA: hypothetical protein VGD50_06435, partial [Candidatus Baltobacteraceae bacterium]
VVVGAAAQTAQGPSTLTCDHLDIDGARQVYHAVGNVHYTQAGRETSSDQAELDATTNQLHLEGRISIRDSGGGAGGVGGFDSINAATIDSDASSGDFTIPGRFTATREGIEISGDHAKGNTILQKIVISGNVIVTLNHGPRAGSSPAAPTSAPSTLRCDRLYIDGVRRVYHALGNVHYHETQNDVTADEAFLREAHAMIHLDGNVHVRQNGQT